MTARLIAIEGLDGSGKETQTQLLREALVARGLKVGSVSFPRYGTPSAAPVEQYLSGGYGDNASDVNAFAASTLFAVDRLASYLGEWRDDYENCDVFIADRYTTSNAIHQLSKLPMDEWENFTRWLFDFEFGKLALPKPDAVIYLRMHLATSQALLSQRYGGDATKRDVHERNLDYLERSCQAADWCSRIFGWLIVECDANAELRSRESVHDEIMALLGWAGSMTGYESGFIEHTNANADSENNAHCADLATEGAILRG